MVSKKKRPPPAIETSEAVPKKSKPAETAGTSSGSNVSTPKTPKRVGGNSAKNKSKADELMSELNPYGADGCSPKSLKRGGGTSAKMKMKSGDDTSAEQEVVVVDTPAEQEVVPENNQCGSEDFPDWTQNDLLELMKRMEKSIPGTDQLRYSSRAEKLDWETISFGGHSAQECKETWMKIQNRLRKFRLLREVLEDAKAWAAKPWTHFYRSQKQNRHPDMPRRPLSSYMLFYMANKDKVTKDNPGLEMTEVSKHIADLFKSLPEKKKKKYAEMAANHRKEYEGKLNAFYHEHPELIPKTERHDSRTPGIGPKKPIPPFKLFLEDKLKRHKNDPGFDKSSFLEKCKEQWKNMPDKKKVIWIDWACEEEARYTEELKAYMSQNPEFVPGNMKTVLTKEEKTLRERVAGKPEKPPNSGYSLFSRLMLASDIMKDFAPKERMSQISRMWKNLPDTQKKKYQERVNHMLDQYKLEYATYLESLPEDKRQEELLSNLPKTKKNVKPKVPEVVEGKKNSKTKDSKHPKNETTGLYKGEPEPPPRDEYQLFLKTLLKKQTYSKKDALKLWDMLPKQDKIKFRKRLSDMKSKYTQDYQKFINGLSQEELKEYSRRDAARKELVEASEDSSKEEESNSSDDSDNDEEEDQDSGSDSSSDSESGSSDSSDSNDGDSKNSGDSSSTASDSD